MQNSLYQEFASKVSQTLTTAVSQSQSLKCRVSEFLYSGFSKLANFHMSQHVKILKTAFLAYSAGTEQKGRTTCQTGWSGYLFSAGCLRLSLCTLLLLSQPDWLLPLGVRGQHCLRMVAQVDCVIFFLELEFSPCSQWVSSKTVLIGLYNTTERLVMADFKLYYTMVMIKWETFMVCSLYLNLMFKDVFLKLPPLMTLYQTATMFHQSNLYALWNHSIK